MIYLGIKALNYRKYLEYPSKFVPIVVFASVGMMLIFTILAFINALPLNIVTSIVMLLFCLISLLEVGFYNSKKDDTEKVTDLIAALVITYIAAALSSADVMVVSKLIILFSSLVLLAISAYMFSALYFIKKKETYVAKPELPSAEDDVVSGIREIQDKLKNSIVTVVNDDK